MFLDLKMAFIFLKSGKKILFTVYKESIVPAPTTLPFPEMAFIIEDGIPNTISFLKTNSG